MLFFRSDGLLIHLKEGVCSKGTIKFNIQTIYVAFNKFSLAVFWFSMPTGRIFISEFIVIYTISYDQQTETLVGFGGDILNFRFVALAMRNSVWVTLEPAVAWNTVFWDVMWWEYILFILPNYSYDSLGLFLAYIVSDWDCYLSYELTFFAILPTFLTC